MKANQLVHLLAECEATRLHLEAGILQRASGEVLSRLIANRIAALEMLAEHMRLVPSANGAFVPPADRRRKKNRQPAA